MSPIDGLSLSPSSPQPSRESSIYESMLVAVADRNMPLWWAALTHQRETTRVMEELRQLDPEHSSLTTAGFPIPTAMYDDHLASLERERMRREELRAPPITEPPLSPRFCDVTQRVLLMAAIFNAARRSDNPLDQDLITYDEATRTS